MYVVNDKFDVSFVLFSGGVNTPAAVTSPVEVAMTSQASYMFGHITRWYGLDEMMVVFSSKFDNGTASVRWGLSPSSLSTVVVAESYTYGTEDL
jgi:hypothetical protein